MSVIRFLCRERKVLFVGDLNVGLTNVRENWQIDSFHRLKEYCCINSVEYLNSMDIQDVIGVLNVSLRSGNSSTEL